MTISCVNEQVTRAPISVHVRVGREDNLQFFISNIVQLSLIGLNFPVSL